MWKLEHRIILPYIKFSNGGLIISLFPYGSLFGEQDLISTIITTIVNLKPLSMFFNRTATVVVFDWFIAWNGDILADDGKEWFLINLNLCLSILIILF